ncbi:MAG: undecaprenyl-phosphate glucose phosphotransferase [Sphingopyxis sp.]|nr:MAG: undecaprenyl-phosphate glucose phosphotransferase [Sphingopyxis sp.]
MINRDNGIIRSNEPFLAIMHRWFDLFVIAVAFFIVLIWQNSNHRAEYWVSLLATLILFYVINDFSRLYGSWRGEHRLVELRKVTGNLFFAFSIMFVVDYFIFQSNRLPDADKIVWFTLGLAGLLSYRIFFRVGMRKLRASGYNTRTVAIAGSGELGRRLAENIIASPWMGLNVVGFYDDKSGDPVTLEEDGQVISTRGTMQTLVQDTRAGMIDKIYITLPMRAEEKIRCLLDELSDTTASVYLIPDVFVFDLLHARSESINGLPSISIFDTPMDGANGFVKRIEDVILSLVILAIIAVPMLLIGLCVRLTSSGPALFKQQRYGIDGKPIEVWKFRSMRVMENGGKVRQATPGDDRITPFGAFLRRTSLDELPQFLNVLRGEMSIVGPRPHAVVHNEEYRKRISGYMLRHKVKPGITGWAQVNGWRGETDTLDKMRKRVECDLDYIRHWSLWLDLKIVFLTVFKGFINKNAY